MDDWAVKIEALEASGLSLTELSEKTGLSISALSDIKQRRTAARTGMAYVRLHELFTSLAKKRKAA